MPTPIHEFPNLFENFFNPMLTPAPQLPALFPTFQQLNFTSLTIPPFLQTITMQPLVSVDFNSPLQNLRSYSESNNLVNKNDQSNIKLPKSQLFVPHDYSNTLDFLYEDYKTTTEKSIIVSNTNLKKNLNDDKEEVHGYTKTTLEQLIQPKYVNRTDYMQNKIFLTNTTTVLPHKLHKTYNESSTELMRSWRQMLYQNYKNLNLTSSTKNLRNDIENKHPNTIHYSSSKIQSNEVKKPIDESSIPRQAVHEKRKVFLMNSLNDKTNLNYQLAINNIANQTRQHENNLPINIKQNNKVRLKSSDIENLYIFCICKYFYFNIK